MCDVLIITDCDSTQWQALLLINSFKTLKRKQPRVIRRNIYDRNRNIDEISKCNKVLFLLSQKTNSFDNLVPRWLNIFSGLQGHKKDILVIEEQQLINDIERGGVIEDNALAEKVQKDNVIEIFSFCSLSSWWPHVIKFVFNLKSDRPNRGSYMFVNKAQDEKTGRVAKILKEVFQAFGYAEKCSADLQFKIRFKKEINQRNWDNNFNAGFNFDVTSDTSNQTISNELLSILTGLDVINPERKYCHIRRKSFPFIFVAILFLFILAMSSWPFLVMLSYR